MSVIVVSANVALVAVASPKISTWLVRVADHVQTPAVIVLKPVPHVVLYPAGKTFRHRMIWFPEAQSFPMTIVTLFVCTMFTNLPLARDTVTVVDIVGKFVGV